MSEEQRWDWPDIDLSTWSWSDDDVYSEEWPAEGTVPAVYVWDDAGTRWAAPLDPPMVVHPGDGVALYWGDPPAMVITRAKPGGRVWWAPWRRRTVVDRYPLREVTDG